MQKNQLSLADTLGLGFMTFAFFLGAGNLIFPPLTGFLAGENMTFAMFGFLFTAVGLPLLALIAVAKANGKIMALLPVGIATLFAVTIFIIIGPAFAAPRTGLVAFEVGLKPFLDDTSATVQIANLTFNLAQLLYTFAFFSVSMVFALFPGKLLDNVGKVLTPILLLLLVGLAVSVIILPGSDVQAASGDYASHPLITGILEGYNTMDALASLIFGILIIDILRKKGIESPKIQTQYLIRAALIAATGLAFVYISLFYLGATAGDLALNVTNGGQILTNYVVREFGSFGLVLLSSVVTLACLTTAVGLLSACSEFFNETFPAISYRFFVVILSIICALVANVGLSELISISVPVLMMIYPVAIALVLVTFLTERFAHPVFSHRLVLSVALLFGVVDGLKEAGVNVDVLDFMPLQHHGMAWLLPTVVTILGCLFLKGEKRQDKNIAETLA
ncbi:branched-chain amino acid transport system II carrier protein [Shewanella surugensis]|uniref:Branched-chain amino acid transport system carrier protein n=1 Tax=Shewanella surugensis TaxID=212020 RepID=A0ABT0LCI4_9GAMM|nr:branched-chain amino acid transport system II carrier protein [Shewanella surugensis]MCL1125190.1 branched-chain amino acid transport system II carrier protein [Shewanella surugensis]